MGRARLVEKQALAIDSKGVEDARGGGAGNDEDSPVRRLRAQPRQIEAFPTGEAQAGSRPESVGNPEGPDGGSGLFGEWQIAAGIRPSANALIGIEGGSLLSSEPKDQRIGDGWADRHGWRECDGE